MQINSSSICIAKVLFEDDDFLTLEVVKDEDREIQLDPDGGDQFFTLMFIRSTGDGTAAIWKPWEGR